MTDQRGSWSYDERGHHHDPEACAGCRRLADVFYAAARVDGSLVALLDEWISRTNPPENALANVRGFAVWADIRLRAVGVTEGEAAPPRIDPERLAPTADELSNLAWLVWYARKRRGKAEDVARDAWMENPYLRKE